MEEGDRERPPPTRQPGDHYTGQPYNSISYQPEYPGQDSQARQQFPPFEYNIPPTPQAFAPMQSYPPARHGQNAAIEVLSSQFSGAPQQYYVTGDPATPVGPPATPHQHHHQQQQQQQPPTQFSSPPYTQYGNNSPAAARLPPLPYPASVPDLNPPAAAEPDDAEYSQHQAAQLDEAYSQYQTALKRTFQNMREGRLGEAGTSLLTISDWLLSNAVELGLVRDEQELHGDRTRLWNEFNTCWLSVLEKEKEMLEEYLSTGQLPQAPRELLREEFLERMGQELVRLCDNMERHGLVDYQMGVWEEEIIDAIQECLRLLEGSAEQMDVSTIPTSRSQASR